MALTAVTAQGPGGVRGSQLVDAGLVRAQIEAVVSDVGVDAVKTGMLGSAAIVAVVAGALPDVPLVVDPVVMSTSGAQLLEPGGIGTLRDELLPRARLVTPNLAEAALLTGLRVEDRAGMEVAAHALVAAGCGAALVTGGHLEGDVVADCLVVGSGDAVWMEASRIHGGGAHGTGCVLSAAVTARLTRGEDLVAACHAAVAFVRAAIAAGGPAGVDPGPPATAS